MSLSELELPLLRSPRQTQELEVVGVLDRVANQLGVGLRKRVVEARQRVALAPSKIGRDLGLQNVAGPPVLECLVGVPLARVAIGELVYELQIVPPRQFAHGL
jgi:hypothetical protein